MVSENDIWTVSTWFHRSKPKSKKRRATSQVMYMIIVKRFKKHGYNFLEPEKIKVKDILKAVTASKNMADIQDGVRKLYQYIEDLENKKLRKDGG